MSRQSIFLGTVANDGTGTDLRTGGDYINDNFAELYSLRDTIYDLNTFVISDENDFYAHESQILIERIDDKALLLVMYRSDKVSEDEAELTGHILLKVYELTTKTFLKSLDLFYPGLTAGVTMSVDSKVWLGRMYVSGTSLICYANNGHTLYTRTIDISSSDASAWTAGNISIAQMTMKNADGDPTLSNVTSANIQIHLENVLSDTNADYNDNVVFFRSLDKMVINGATWIATLEAYGVGAKSIVVTSTDSGASWTLGNLVNYTTVSRTNQMEMSLAYNANKSVLYAIARTGSGIVYLSSADDGATWSTATAITGGMATKPVMINYYKDDGALDIVVAFNRTSEITENNYRTTLYVYTTQNMATMTEIAKIISHNYAHYPSLCHFSRSLYLSYTKGMKFNTDGDAVTDHNRNTIVVTRIY